MLMYSHLDPGICVGQGHDWDGLPCPEGGRETDGTSFRHDLPRPPADIGEPKKLTC